MGQWSKLSAKEKAQIIKFAIDNGVSDINSIRDTYNVYASGGSIHIDKNKKGTFTAAATKHGKSVQEFARQVLDNKENYSPAIVKKANFARNAASWKHSTGGPLYPFSFQKNPYLKVPAVRYGNGGKKLTPSKAQIVRSAWDNENPFNIGLLKNGMYEQYDDPNGEGRDVGPGLLVGATIPDKKLYTRQELEDAAYAFGMEGRASIGKAYNEKYGTEKFPTPFDTVSVAPKLLLLDTRYQNGRLPIANWPALYQSVADGNWAEALKNSRSTYIKDGVKHYDNDRVRRRAESIFPGMFDVIFTPDSKEFPKVTNRKKSKK